MRSRYTELDKNSQFKCPYCKQVIEDMGDDPFWEPCEHVVACYLGVTSEWEILSPEMEEKMDEDSEAAEAAYEAGEEFEDDPEDIEEWGTNNIPADQLVVLQLYGMACGPIQYNNYYFFKRPKA